MQYAFGGSKQKQTKPSIMWLISLSISSILVIITINVLSTSNNNNIVANGNFIFGNNNNKPTLRPTTHRRHSVLSRAAKQMKKITKDGIKLIDKKNIARCVYTVYFMWFMCMYYSIKPYLTICK